MRLVRVVAAVLGALGNVATGYGVYLIVDRYGVAEFAAQFVDCSGPGCAPDRANMYLLVGLVASVLGACFGGVALVGGLLVGVGTGVLAGVLDADAVAPGSLVAGAVLVLAGLAVMTVAAPAPSLRARLRRLPFAGMFTDDVLVGEGLWSSASPATAVVLQATVTGRSVHEQTELRVRVRLEPASGADPVEAERCVLVPDDIGLSAGDRLAALYDADDPRRFILVADRRIGRDTTPTTADRAK